MKTLFSKFIRTLKFLLIKKKEVTPQKFKMETKWWMGEELFLEGSPHLKKR
ncbi:hypothetical protein ABDK00_011170 [Niabella insulamsoli]|uniref:hypothetical protein n=1 Tax=Niabella insulamsoli TaxID=3144874 RepID=UPI0031FD0846